MQSTIALSIEESEWNSVHCEYKISRVMNIGKINLLNIAPNDASVYANFK